MKTATDQPLPGFRFVSASEQLAPCLAIRITAEERFRGHDHRAAVLMEVEIMQQRVLKRSIESHLNGSSGRD